MLKFIILCILCFILIYYIKKDTKKEIIKENKIDIKQYPNIYKFKDILDIYSQLFFLTQFNKHSFYDSLFYMNSFLELIHKNEFISNNIQHYLDYSTLAINSLQSIIINIPIQYGILKSNNKIFSDPTTKITDYLVNQLNNSIESYREFIISNINQRNLDNININSTFIYDMKENNTQTIDYSPHFNLYS